MNIEKWTLEEKNKFFTLLMGKCWHDFPLIEDGFDADYHSLWRCPQCNVKLGAQLPYYDRHDFYHDLSGFQIIKDFMEKNLPKVWEDYLESFFLPRTRTYTDTFSEQLSLDNLLNYLLEHKEEWAYTEKRVCEYKDNCGGPCVELMTTVNMYCKDGIICEKHPALLFAEGKEER